MTVLKLLICNPPKPMKRKRGEEGKKSMCLLFKLFLKKQRKENPTSSEKHSQCKMEMSPPLSSLAASLLPPFQAMGRAIPASRLWSGPWPFGHHRPTTHLLFISRSALLPQAWGMCVKMRVGLQMKALQNYSGPGAQMLSPAIQPGDRSPNTGRGSFRTRMTDVHGQVQS